MVSSYFFSSHVHIVYIFISEHTLKCHVEPDVNYIQTELLRHKETLIPTQTVSFQSFTHRKNLRYYSARIHFIDEVSTLLTVDITGSGVTAKSVHFGQGIKLQNLGCSQRPLY